MTLLIKRGGVLIFIIHNNLIQSKDMWHLCNEKQNKPFISASILEKTTIKINFSFGRRNGLKLRPP